MRSQPSIATSAIHNFSDKSAALKLRSVHASPPTALALGRPLSVERGSGACQEIDAGGPLSQKSTAPEHPRSNLHPRYHDSSQHHTLTSDASTINTNSYITHTSKAIHNGFRCRECVADWHCQPAKPEAQDRREARCCFHHYGTPTHSFEAKLHGSKQLTCLERLLESPDSERPHSSTPSSLPPSRTMPITSAVTQSRSTRPSRLRLPRPSSRRSSSRVRLP